MTNNEITGAALTCQRHLKVALSSGGNPDHFQVPFESLPGVPKSARLVNSIAEASRLCSQYIEKHELGAGNWTGGDIFEGSALVARVSYNGRVWAQ